MSEEYAIKLTDYEIANLKSMIEAVGYPSHNYNTPLGVFNSGDWLGQIYNKLPIIDYLPNRSPQEYRKMAKEE